MISKTKKAYKVFLALCKLHSSQKLDDGQRFPQLHSQTNGLGQMKVQFTDTIEAVGRLFHCSEELFGRETQQIFLKNEVKTCFFAKNTIFKFPLKTINLNRNFVVFWVFFLSSCWIQLRLFYFPVNNFVFRALCSFCSRQYLFLLSFCFKNTLHV